MAEPRTPEQVLADLRDVADELGELMPKVKACWARRDVLYTEARALDPPITQRLIAQASGVSEVAVTRSMAKIEERAAKAAGNGTS
ncbi:MAG: hypothetical protein SHS37scaffold145_35 [Phage 71_18]|nr:MAG: hypothetical protein SHS37scaffold145_35 [Phage 71_18]